MRGYVCCVDIVSYSWCENNETVKKPNVQNTLFSLILLDTLKQLSLFLFFYFYEFVSPKIQIHTSLAQCKENCVSSSSSAYNCVSTGEDEGRFRVNWLIAHLYVWCDQGEKRSNSTYTTSTIDSTCVVPKATIGIGPKFQSLSQKSECVCLSPSLTMPVCQADYNCVDLRKSHSYSRLQTSPFFRALHTVSIPMSSRL